ncbi:MAG: PKD domain-containing protein [Chitinophagaceae bacterium]|nr:MAG: PKD domain-containing protein [Chitinophagaceae bacterium]
MKKTLLLLFGILGFAVTHAQPINVNTTTYTVPQLVTDVLFGDGTSSTSCAGSVTNITWSTGTNFGQVNGIGYFTNTNPAFPMSSGVILSSGAATGAPGPNGGTQSGGNWPGDTDLFNYIQSLNIDPGLTDYNDATVLEFDFTPLTSNMSFDFLFASEEYGTFQCSYSDAFAFFLTDVTAGTPTTNLALVPGAATPTPISVITIRDDANNNSCGDSYPQFFDTFDNGSGASTPTNFNGTTTMMTAGSAVIPGHTYHIKLVIADRNDNLLDSGVFLGGGSFDIGQANIEGTGQYAGLSTDYLIADGTGLCPQQTITIQAGPAPAANATYSWALNTFPIPGADQFSLVVSAPGTYTVTATYGPTCSQSDDVIVEYLPTPAFGTPINLTSTSTFNLTQNTPIILNGLSGYDVNYHHNLFDAQNIANPIANPATYAGVDGEQIFASVEDTNTGCIFVVSFFLSTDSLATTPPDLVVCDDPSNNGTATFDLTVQTPIVLGSQPAADYTITYHLTQADADNDASPIGTPSAFVNTTNPQTIYVRMENIADPTSFSTVSFDLIINPQPGIPVVSNVSACSDVGYTLPALPPGSTYHSASGGAAATLIPVGTVYNTPNTTNTVYVFAQSATTPNCTAESSFTVTINQKPATPAPSNATACSDVGYALPALPAGSTYHSASGGAAATLIPVGTVYNTPNTTNTIYVFAESGTVPNCTAEGSFTVTINQKPAVPNPSDVFACSDIGYTLPALPAGSTYHSAAGGAAATLIAPGTVYNTPNTTNTVYVFAESGTVPNCTSEGDFIITIYAKPATPNPSDVSACSDIGYTLPALPAGSTYHSAPGGSAATAIATGTIYNTPNTTTTVYVYSESGTTPNCTSEGDFTITINQKPATPNPSDVFACSDIGYTLPALPAGSTYHSAPGGGAATAIAAGTVYNTPNTTTTIYVFAESGTVPNCTSEGDFVVTIYEKPAVPNPADVSACSFAGYTLPALPAGQSYHSAPGGAAATQIAAGTLYNTPNTVTTIYIYAESGTTPNCTSEGDFTVTINPSPITPNPADVAVCNSYALPALPANQSYHTAAGGAASTLITLPATITTTQTIWIFDQTGTVPNCTAEGDFLVTINPTPMADNPADVVACDSYTLPVAAVGHYYSAPNGGGTILDGTAITTTQTVGEHFLFSGDKYPVGLPCVRREQRRLLVPFQSIDQEQPGDGQCGAFGDVSRDPDRRPERGKCG